jgi:hypothetical protein
LWWWWMRARTHALIRAPQIKGWIEKRPDDFAMREVQVRFVWRRCAPTFGRRSQPHPPALQAVYSFVNDHLVPDGHGILAKQLRTLLANKLTGKKKASLTISHAHPPPAPIIPRNIQCVEGFARAPLFSLTLVAERRGFTFSILTRSSSHGRSR